MPRVRVGELELAYSIEGGGEPLLVLAPGLGLGGATLGWDLLRGELAGAHRLILVDHRDTGASGAATSSYSMGELGAEVVALMDHLGIERFHLVGASMGAAVAQHVALQAPTRVASMVLVSAW